MHKNITTMPIDERNKLGISVMLQSPPAVKGVKLESLVELNGDGYRELSRDLDVDKFLDRGVNDGLSGGEIKRSEVFQLALDKKAKFYLIDEPDSGVDPENLHKIGAVINKLVHGGKKSALIVTHSGEILNYIDADRAYVMIDGQTRCEGNPGVVFKRIQEEGYNTCMNCKGDLINE
jgi:Fe-S cluster assembly ATP-binding protein